MDEIKNPTQKKVQEALSETPEEVQSFMWGEEYESIIKAIGQALSLTDDQLTMVRTDSYTLLMKLETLETLYKKWVTSGMSGDLANKVLYLIDSEIISRVLEISEPVERDEEEATEDITTQEVSTPSSIPSVINPTDTLADLGARLSQSSVIAPTKRDYSVTAGGDVVAPKETSHSFDPYRELPEK